MTQHPIPTDALDDRLGYFGTAGSGKTYNAGSGVERLLAAKKRVIIPDPLGVWWGLRLNADGKSKGFDVVIFGGPHGDLPLTEHVGALIGETVAGMKESCILDLSELGTKAAERRFMLAFLAALYKHVSGEPVHVVFDEADMWAPQKLLDKEGDAAKLLGMMETLVRRGRVKGFIPWLISQRPAVLSKDVLSQVDGLVAFKLTSSQDRDALGDWVKGQADIGQWNEIWKSLPTLERGQGVVWLPARGTLRTASFPAKATFDSSRTPKRGEKTTDHAALKPLDLDKLRERLATVEAETKANDPRALKAEIAKLKRDLAAKPTAPAADPDAEGRAYNRGYSEGADKTLRAIASLAADLSKTIERAEQACGDAKRLLESFSGFTDAIASDAAKRPRAPVVRQAPRSAQRIAPPLVKANGQFTGPQHRVLRSLAMWRVLGHPTPSREMVAAASGYSPSSGGFNNLLGGLATAGAIGKPMAGHLSLLVDVEDMTADDGRAMLLGYLSNPQRKLVDALNGNGAISRDDLGAATDYSPSSGGFNNLIGSLSTLGLIAKPQPGYVALSDWAQELLS